MKLILTRHTTTEWNSVGRIQGQTDISLGPVGREEAQRLSEMLSPLGIHMIVSSDLKRAKETAGIINSVLQVPLQIEARLRECSFGKFEGLTKEQVIERYGLDAIKIWEDQHLAYDFRPFGGEHRDSVFARHIEVINQLADKHSEKVVLLVGHGRGMCTLLGGLGHSPDLKRGEYRLIEFNQ